MATLRDIRRRIKSIKSTSQITRAMQMVAAAKMKKAQDQAVAGRDYAALLNQVLRNLKAKVNEEAHPLLQKRAGTRELMLVISTDKGLLGALNTNLGKRIRLETSDTTEFVTVGRKLRTALGKAGRTLIADFEVKDPVPFDQARPIAKFLTEKFLSGQYDRITVAFTNFVNTLTQEPWVSQLLPIDAGKLAEKQDYEGVSKGDKLETAAVSADYIFEPAPEEVLNTLLPLYVNFQIYQMLVESRASEHSARMVAMKSATDNAKEIVKDLTLDYNKLRQAAITAELLEITTAQKVME
jgi:F-type H+-transporting ATPase subunit gamma